MGQLDGHATLALAIAIGVLPAFGITMVLLDRAGKHVFWLGNLVVYRAPWVYGAFLAGGVAAGIATGLLNLDALSMSFSLGGTLVAALLVPVAVLVPYAIELALSGRGPRAASGFLRSLPDPHGAVAFLSGRGVEWWILAAGTAVLEEALFRGMLMSALTTSAGALVAVVVSGAVFGAHHMAFGFPAIVGKLVAGLAWGGLMVLSGTIAVPLACHLLFQALVRRRMVRLQSGPSEPAGQPAGQVGGVR